MVVGMVERPRLALAGGLTFGAGVTLAVYVVASLFAPPLVAAVPTLLVAGIVLALAGQDWSGDDGPPTAEDLEGQP